MGIENGQKRECHIEEPRSLVDEASHGLIFPPVVLLVGNGGKPKEERELALEGC